MATSAATPASSMGQFFAKASPQEHNEADGRKPAMLQIIRSQKVYDVCIIGSGAAGGGAAKVLTEGGLEVVMLEAGPLLNPAKHFTEHLWPYQLPHRGAGIGGSGYDASGSHELDVAFISGHIRMSFPLAGWFMQLYLTRFMQRGVDKLARHAELIQDDSKDLG
jgi:glycine/D-amino acid oxidase-like deaminating enzyme